MSSDRTSSYPVIRSAHVDFSSHDHSALQCSNTLLYPFRLRFAADSCTRSRSLGARAEYQRTTSCHSGQPLLSADNRSSHSRDCPHYVEEFRHHHGYDFDWQRLLFGTNSFLFPGCAHLPDGRHLLLRTTRNKRRRLAPHRHN